MSATSHTGPVTGAMIEVASGNFVDLLNPDPSTITLTDIGRGLANTCRYGGHVKRFYSVAEHSVFVRDLLRSLGATRGTQIAALFHDAAEAFLGDVVAPLKWALRQHAPNSSAYDDLAARMDTAIADAFTLDRLIYAPSDIHTGDLWALKIEATELATSKGASWNWPPDLPNNGQLPHDVIFYGGLGPNNAYSLWLEAAEDLLYRSGAAT